MTPFDYDARFANPNDNRFPVGIHTGWQRHCVWGCKRPELLISETLAFHDRRTQDLDTEIPDEESGRRTGSPKPAESKVLGHQWNAPDDESP